MMARGRQQRRRNVFHSTTRSASSGLALLGMVLIALLLSACGGGGASTSTAAPTAGAASTTRPGGPRKDTFTMGQSTPITNLNPNPWNAGNQIWRRAIFDTLVTVDPQPQPSLATAWTVSPDGTTYTFTIRSGVKYQNGKEFDAQSVVDNLKWAADPQNNVTGGAVLAQASFEAHRTRTRSR